MAVQKLLGKHKMKSNQRTSLLELTFRQHDILETAKSKLVTPFTKISSTCT